MQESDIEYLRQAARLTWRFFDDLVNDESHWLPPDNTQLALRVEVARRTSPTNIGFWFVSALTAHDFGWLPATEFSRRCSETIATMDVMARQDGHFYNWYDIDTLTPLHPHYISSADSGNLLAVLWTTDRGIDDLLNGPVLPGYRASDGASRRPSAFLRKSPVTIFTSVHHAAPLRVCCGLTSASSS